MGDDEPLNITSVSLLPGVSDTLWAAYGTAEAARRGEWSATHGGGDPPPPSLYANADEFASLVTQVSVMGQSA